MQLVGRVLCPSCAKEINPNDALCAHCGGDLSTVRPAQDRYQLVCDGQKFGIALRGRIVLRSMDLRDAQSTLAIFNGKPEK
jgi:hypothetical protein